MAHARSTHPNSSVSSFEIPRESASSLFQEQFAQRYQTLGLPVVITELFPPEWDWTLDYLCQVLGDRQFILRYYGHERYSQDKRTWTSIGSGVPPQTKPFSEYADLLRSGEASQHDIYLAKCPLYATPLMETEAMQCVNRSLHQLGLIHSASPLNLWVGPAGHIECLHYDPMDGTLIQLHGSKKIILFPPSQTANLYPFPVYVHLRHGMKLRAWFSQVYPDRPDFDAFPNLRTALQHRHDVILNPGEALYIPTGWWHEVISLRTETLGTETLENEMVCSVNRFWRVYPTRRALLSWGRWRAHLGSMCAIPNTAVRLGKALLNRDRTKQLKEIFQMF